MNTLKKIGTFGDFHFFSGTRCGVTGIFYGYRAEGAVNLIDTRTETVEGFAEALRAAAADPQDELMAALADYIPDAEDPKGFSKKYRRVIQAYRAARDAREDIQVVDQENEDY
jgi:hypothetical protein